MIYRKNINTEIILKSVEDLYKLKILIEVNNLDKPNFSAIARELGVDRRTVKKYYDGNIKKDRKPKKSKIDDFYDVISSLLSAETKQIFYYKSHLYRYLVREKGLNCSRSDFNYYILKHENFAEYFKPKKKRDAVKSETPFGKQAQFDWKEDLKFSFRNGEEFIFNVGSLILSASRFKYWAVCPTKSQAYLFDFLANALEELEGVPQEILIDNASTMMDKARTELSAGKVNPKFQQFADDFGFKIVPCVRARPNTKAKVENPMRIIDEIMSYNGLLDNEEQLHNKMQQITNEANSRICQATGIPPILVFKKEKEHILPLPNDKICSYYKNTTINAKVNSNSLFRYKGNLYSVPIDFIGKSIVVKVIDNNLYVYYDPKMITLHTVSNEKINYHDGHHLAMMGLTFKNSDQEDVKNYAAKHLEEMKKFNEQLSTITGDLRELKLTQMSLQIDDYINKINDHKTSIVDALCELTSKEVEVKNFNAAHAMVKVAGFPHLKELKDFDFDFQPKINKQQFLDFESLRFLENNSSIILIGNSGVGKTHLATSIGIAAAKKRVSTYFIKCQDLIEQLKKAYLENKLDDRIKHFSKYKLLIIDEIGYLPIGEQEAKMFFQLIDRRYEKKSTIVTSNINLSDWNQIFVDNMLASAILDRLVHHSTIVNILGNSYRTATALSKMADKNN